jgi:tetratricopeptide (TPR) repeat protein
MADGGEAERLNTIARSELLHASALAPQDAQIAYCLGHALYMDRALSIEEALTWFDCALPISSTHPWARLYRAHCLHDLERWQEAAQAYAQVPRQPFMGPASWRMHLAAEQQAWCALRAGDIAGARQQFEMILARYEKEPGLWDWSEYLEPAANEFFPDLLERVTERRRLWEEKA